MKSQRLWKELIKGLHLKLNESGEVVETPRDPSLRSQLYERSNLVDSERMAAYLEACAKAPNASSATKRKWKTALFGKPVIT